MPDADPYPDIPAPPARPRPTGSLDGVLRPLDPRVVQLWRLIGLLKVAIICAAAAAAVRWLQPPVPLPLLLAVLLVLGLTYVALRPPSRYRAWGYDLRSEDVLVRHGVWWRTVSVVPYVRIQHVDTRQGPLERMLGLATVVFFTAGTVGAAVDVPGLALEDAEHLRERLALLSGADDAV